jgi:formate dehydrogenase subunit beta
MGGETRAGNESMAEGIRRSVRELFDAKRIDLLVGFSRGSVGYRARPAFVSSPAEADGLVWDATCSHNLAVYLPSLFRRQPQRKGGETPLPRVGFVVKGCDMRSIVALVKENQAPRESLVLIGVPCRGMIDEGKLEAEVGGEIGAAAVASLEDDGETASVTMSDGRSLRLPRESLVQDSCRACRHPAPEGADIMMPGESRAAYGGDDAAVREFGTLPVEERWRRFSGEISKCIRCYACRQACPTCYCTECFADLNSPAWIGASNELSDVMVFHLMRIFHQAGRCVECDACVRACPMGIDLRTFTKKIAADVRELFGFTPGFDLETPPPLCTFKEDDRQSFISEPREG